MTYTETNDIIPTAKQERRAMAKARDDARAELEVALNALDSAKQKFDFIGDEDRYRDCVISMSTVEDLKDSMEVDDG